LNEQEPEEEAVEAAIRASLEEPGELVGSQAAAEAAAEVLVVQVPVVLEAQVVWVLVTSSHTSNENLLHHRLQNWWHRTFSLQYCRLWSCEAWR
jgi:hypothetical protein